MTNVTSSPNDPNQSLARRIANIRSKVSIFDIMSGFVDFNISNNTISGLCPFHIDQDREREFTLVVDTETQSFYCSSCKAYGSVIAFVEGVLDISFEEAMRFLERYIASDANMKEEMLRNSQ